MKGYYEGYSYVGFMLDGKKMRFATEQEYVEAYREEEAFIQGPLFLFRNVVRRLSKMSLAKWARTIIEKGVILTLT